MGDLLLHATVVWINPPSSLMKGKKDPELAVFGKCVFVCVLKGDWKRATLFPGIASFLLFIT